MTNTRKPKKPSIYREAKKFRCHYCGAEPGRECINRYGQRIIYIHPERKATALVVRQASLDGGL